jgi:hypothetical protein
MAFPRPASPRVLIDDIRRFFAQGHRHKILFAVVSIAIPLVVIAGFIHDSVEDERGQEIIYVQDWRADRSDAEIIAQQKIDKAVKDKKAAETQAAYKRLADMLGIE